jgi:ParB-like chromosome segregation protein Spo0J
MTTLKFHPLSDLFPLLEGEEFDALVADIKANGLIEPIVMLDGMILDGRHRYRACLAAGVEPRFTDYRGDNPTTYVISVNIHRRHLAAEDKRDLLVKLVAAQPQKSDRAIAREAKVDHHQVSRARKKAEATGTIVPVEKRVGGDGKARKQPARKAKAEVVDGDDADRPLKSPENSELDPRDDADGAPTSPPELPPADAPLDRRSYCPVCEGEGKLEDGEEDDVVFLAWSAREIASMLIAMDDQTKLKKIAAFIRDHLKHPNRTWKERHAALGLLGMSGLDGPLTKKQVLERLRLGGEEPQQFSWRVDAIGKDGKRYRSGVRLKTKAEAKVYRDAFAAFEVPDYASAEIIRCCDDEPKQSIVRKTKGGRPYLGFMDGECHLLRWHPIDDAGNDDGGLDVSPFLDRNVEGRTIGEAEALAAVAAARGTR